MWHNRFEIKWNRFWRLVALWIWKHNVTPKWKRIIIEKCVCDCWNEKRISRSNLLNWLSTSCWCRWWEHTKWKPSINRSHWMTATRIYKIYYWIKRRCNNNRSKNYSLRWIKCSWNNFEDFYKDMWKSYEEHVKKYWESNTTIDRINPDWNYCKENCRRATYKEQNNNRGNNVLTVYKWKRYKSIKLMCDELWLNYNRVMYRLSMWWNVKDAIEKPKYNHLI